MIVSPKPKPGEEGYVGYKNPPKDRQFKPGKSGNSKGRPKGPKSDQTLYETAATQPVTGRDANGRTYKITAREAAYRQLLLKAASGSAPHLALFLKYEERFGWLRPPPDPDAPRTGVLVVPYGGATAEEQIAHCELAASFQRKKTEKLRVERARLEREANAAAPPGSAPVSLSDADALVILMQEGARPFEY